MNGEEERNPLDVVRLVLGVLILVSLLTPNAKSSDSSNLREEEEIRRQKMEARSLTNKLTNDVKRMRETPSATLIMCRAFSRVIGTVLRTLLCSASCGSHWRTNKTRLVFPTTQAFTGARVPFPCSSMIRECIEREFIKLTACSR